MEAIENTTMNMPVLALRGLTVFPGCVLSFDVERGISIRALERAMEPSGRSAPSSPGSGTCTPWAPCPPCGRSCASARGRCG